MPQSYRPDAFDRVRLGQPPEGPLVEDHRVGGDETEPGPTSRGASHDYIVATGLGALTLVLRLLYAAKGPTDWDSSQFVSGTSRYDVTHGSPHPPGYFLYVEGGRFLHAVTGLNRVDSLVLIAALASSLASAVLYLAAIPLLRRPWAAAAVVLVATSPIAWLAGSIVNTYSFDQLGAAAMLYFATRARPGGKQGAAAVLTLAVLAGFRPSVLETLSLFALLVVAGCVRTVRGALEVVGAGLIGLAVWVIPVAIIQPGGLSAWYRAAHSETIGAYHAGSLFYPNHGAGQTNLGILASYTLILLGIPALVWLIGVVGLLASGRSPREWWPHGDQRGWWQRPFVLFIVGVLPAIGVYISLLFGKGGYALAYAPTATVLLLYPISVLNPRWPGVQNVIRVAAVGLLLAGIIFNVQRFTQGKGILPSSVQQRLSGLWLTKKRYGAPFSDTAAYIRTSDSTDKELEKLGPALTASDVLLIAMNDPLWSYYRNAGWALPKERIYIVSGSGLVYGEQNGLLYYVSGPVVPIGPAERALILASSDTPTITALVNSGEASAITDAPGPLRLWQLQSGGKYLGVTVSRVATPSNL